MKYIGHRGYSIRYRDNSIEAIHEAVSRNYDGIELDIQLCATGEIVLFHDVYVDSKFICDMDLDELKKHNICTLKDVYKHVPKSETLYYF